MSANSFFGIFIIAKLSTYIGMAIGLTCLGSRWIGHLPDTNQQRLFLGRRKPIRLGPNVNVVADASQQEKSYRPAIKSRVYSALIWQSFRQFRTTFMYTMMGASPILLGLMLISATISDFALDPVFFSISFAVALVAISLMGSMFVFLMDQQDHNYRFFQQHREFGRKLWFARLLPAGLLSMGCAMIMAIGIIMFSLVNWNEINAALVPFVFSAVLAVLSGFALGQFNSMFLRSGVFIVVSVMVMSGILFAGIGWLAYLGSGWLSFLVPIPLAMLAITWWRAPHWLAERNRIANLVIPWATLAAVTIGVIAAFAYIRVASVPDQGLDDLGTQYALYYNSRAFLEPKDNQRSQLLRQAADSILNTEEITETHFNLLLSSSPTSDYSKNFIADNAQRIKRLLNKNQKSLDLIKQADNGPAGVGLLDPESSTRRAEQTSKIALLVSAQAWMAEQEGDLELALEHWLQFKRFSDEYDPESFNAMLWLIRWSELPDQSPDLIKPAIKACEVRQQQWFTQSLGLTQSRMTDVDNWYEGIKTGRTVYDAPHGIEFNYFRKRNDSNRSPSNSIGTLIPWEMERSKRLVYQALEKFFMQRCGLINSATNPGSWHRSMDYNGSYFRHQGVAPYKEWQRFTELFSIHHYHYWLDFMSITKSIQVRRYAQVRMALNAWKIEHGEYPERLSDLVPTYFEVLPVDVLSGNSYAYSAKGLDFKVGTSGWNGTSDVEVVLNDYESLIDPGTPFLLPWAASSQPKLFKCTVTNESSIEPFKCFDYSDPDRFQVHFLRFNIPFALARPQTNSD